MGYYTNYTLKYTEDKEEDDAYLERLGVEEKEVYVDHEEQLWERYYASFEEATKWYDWQKNMKEYSKEYPDTLFELSGEGEESGDIWRAYFKNGKMQYCQARIVFDEFDESKLE